MKRYQLTITLLEDCIFSERAASEGGHQSLDYIPGISLLGACASKIYSKLGKQSFDVFHSGKVRFGNGYPQSTTGEDSLPMPFVWHGEKGKEVSQRTGDKRVLLPQNIINLSKKEMVEDKQPKQLRKGYVTNALEHLEPTASLRMKTAINPETATAAKSQLFGYQAIEAGQIFTAYLDIDEGNDCVSNGVSDGISDAQSKMIRDALSGDLFLGRSRTAQYGAVQCEIQEVILPSPNQSKDQEINIWFVSDTALLDKNGLPVTANSIKIPELETNKILWDKSFLRYRRYSPYNSKRRKFDLERQVIEKGSVLTLKLNDDNEFSPDFLGKLQDKLQKGIGSYREAGLGQIIIQHPLLQDANPVATQTLEHRTIESPDMPKNPLANFLNNIYQSSKTSRVDRQYAEKKAEELKQLYKRAYAYAAVDKGVELGPSASQWSRIAEAGKRYQYQKDKDKLHRKLFGDNSSHDEKNQDIICKRKDEAWSVISFDNDNKEITFRTWLKAVLNDKNIQQPGTVATLLSRMASNIVKQNKEKVT